MGEPERLLRTPGEALVIYASGGVAEPIADSLIRKRLSTVSMKRAKQVKAK